MPEYLAPGVYVEEVPSGSKPIEGVSTSTAGMVGATQRGPVDEPTLVTSFPEYTRRFGGYLDHRLFTNRRDLLPYAAEGFFTNGGQRLYVTRVVGPDAAFSEADVFGLPTEDGTATTLVAQANPDDTALVLRSGDNVTPGSRLLLLDGTRSEYVTVEAVAARDVLALNGPLRIAFGDGDAVHLQDVTEGAEVPFAADTPGALEAGGDLDDGDGGLVLDLAGLADGVVLRLTDTEDPARTEYVTVPDVTAGDVGEGELLFDHPPDRTAVRVVTLADAADGQTTLDGAHLSDVLDVAVAASADLEAGSVVAISGGGNRDLQVLHGVHTDVTLDTTFDAATDTVPSAYAAVGSIHAAGVRVSRQEPLFRAVARYEGGWGNGLRVRALRSTQLRAVVLEDVAQGASPVRLDTVVGLSEGSVLELPGPDGPVRERVAGVDTDLNEVEFAGGVDVALSRDDELASVEFDLIVERVENGRVVESEAFEGLAMDAAHPRYAPAVVGRFDVAAGEPERVGASNLVRLVDLASGAANEADRRLSVPFDGPGRGLAGGTDDATGIDDARYVGTPAVDPDQRTGLQSLENIDDISIVAVPGQTGQDVQNAVVAHCEKMRYRFAVLDAPLGADVAGAQRHRQLYDTTYAALYHPWLEIRDAFGRAEDVVAIPPSGHVAGIYARTDVRRGVQKAPANEVILGVRDLRVSLTKGEQDILNPRHVNCLRNFRDLGRGLRVWGARTLSSDPEWRYVPVRRLFLFVEKSIERGTQFAVFEPNGEGLWATVRRSLSGFLTSVWRDGGLAGVTPEEAFFVKVDRSTMTEQDIATGRMICLVGIAPVFPAEFVIFRISQKTLAATD